MLPSLGDFVRPQRLRPCWVAATRSVYLPKKSSARWACNASVLGFVEEHNENESEQFPRPEDSLFNFARHHPRETIVRNWFFANRGNQSSCVKLITKRKKRGKRLRVTLKPSDQEIGCHSGPSFSADAGCHTLHWNPPSSQHPRSNTQR